LQDVLRVNLQVAAEVVEVLPCLAWEAAEEEGEVEVQA
jgi:hypothetical protein